MPPYGLPNLEAYTGEFAAFKSGSEESCERKGTGGAELDVVDAAALPEGGTGTTVDETAKLSGGCQMSSYQQLETVSPMALAATEPSSFAVIRTARLR